MDAGEDKTARKGQPKYRVLLRLFMLAAAQPPPVAFLTIAIVVGLVIGVVGHVVHARPLILLGILIVGAVCGYVVVSSYVGAFG
jgi:Flp pilus assembly protein TadB